MNKYKNNNDLIDAFFSGETDAFSGTFAYMSNTKIKGDQLIHFETPILERVGDKIIFNETKYSIQTDRLQKLIKEKLFGKDVIYVSGVLMDHKGSLSEFIK